MRSVTSLTESFHPCFPIPLQPLVTGFSTYSKLLTQTASRKPICLRQTHKPHFFFHLGYFFPPHDYLEL